MKSFSRHPAMVVHLTAAALVLLVNTEPAARATVSELTVVVPAGATYAPIPVTMDGLVGCSATPFQPTFAGNGSPISSSTFAARFDLAGGDGAHRSAIADLDGDGKPDLAVVDVYGHTISLFRNVSSPGSLHLNSFEPRVVLPAEGGESDNPYGFTTADVDGDGRLDLVACDRIGNNISVYRNIASPGILTPGSFAPHVNFPVGADPRYARVADLDGDGRPDIVSCNYAGDTLSILRNIGTAGSLALSSFAPHVELPASDGPYDVAIGDLDGDGRPDLAVANTDAATTSLYRNLSTPGTIDRNSFALRVELPAADGNDTIALGDLDGDGRPDLVIGSFRSYSVSVYRNQATLGVLDSSSFAPRVDFSTGNWTHTVALGDVNGDGRTDIATVGELDSYLSVFENLSTPGEFSRASLGSRVDFGAGWNAWGVSLGDLDLDGRLDIAFCNAYDDTVSVYRNVSPRTNPPPPTSCPTEVIAWWKAEDNALDQLGVHDGETPFGMAYADGMVGRAFDLDGSFRRVSVPDSPAFKLTNAMTLEAWVYPRAYQGFITFRGDDRGGLDTWTLDTYQPGFVNFQIDDAANNYTSVLAPLTLNQWQHVAATWERASGDMKVYVNGTLSAQTNTSIVPIVDLDAEAAVGVGNHGGTFHQFPFNGLIDEMAIYSRALTAGEIAAIHSAGSAGKCSTNPPPLGNLLVNGTFELPSGVSYYQVVGVGTDLPGWVVGSGSVDVLGPHFEPAEGSQSLDLNGDSEGSIYQDIATEPGQTYRVRFAYAGNPESSPTHKTATVSWNAASLTNLSFDITGRSVSDMGWVYVECLATATGTTSRLVFQASCPGAKGLTLDDVSVTTSGPPAMGPPLIVEQPQDQSVPAGGSALFTVGATGTGPLACQWWLETNALPGQTSASLVLSNVQPAQAGSYFVVVSSAVSSVTSSNAVLTVQTFPPVITQHPVNQMVREGRSALFSVQATGTAPLSYQWFFGDQELPGQTGRSLTLGSATTNQAGSYFVTVSSAYGFAQSSNALLTVLPPPVCVPVPTDVVAWWPGESNTWDVVGGSDGSFGSQPPPVTLLYTTGMVGTAFRFMSSWAVAVPQSPELDLGIGDGFTFEGWVKPENVSSTFGIFGWGGSGSGFPSSPVGVNLRILNPGIVQAQLVKTNGQIIVLESAPSSLQLRVWQHVALSCNTTNGEVAIHVNGLAVAQTNLGPAALRTIGALRLGNAAGPPFFGAMDEPTLYSRALSPAEIQSVYLADEAGKCPPPPPPCLQLPGTVALWHGESNTMDSVAGNNALILPTGFPSNQAYQVGQNQNGAAFAFRGPNFLSVPKSDGLDVGKSEGLTIEGWIYPQTSSGVPIVEWTDSNSFGVYLALGYTGPGSLDASLTDVAGGLHRVVAPYAIGSAYWAHVALTYDKASGQAALFLNGTTVAATNLGSFTPRTDTDLLIGFHPRYPGSFISGGPPTSDRRFIGAMDELAIYRRALSVQEIHESARPRAGRCLEWPPIIRHQPTDQIALGGGSAAFQVAAGGTQPLSYQWFFSGTAIADGADGPMLQLANVQPAEAGNYSVMVSNALGSVTSRVATLTVLPANQCLPTPYGAVAFWRGQSNTLDELGTHPAAWGTNTPAAYVNGRAGSAFRFNGASYLLIRSNADLNVGAGGGFTIEGWIKPDTIAGMQPLVDWNDGRQNVGVGLMLGRTGPGVLEVTLTDTRGTSTDRTVTFATPNYSIGSPTNPRPDWTHVALTFEKARGKATLFVNAKPVAERTVGLIYTSPEYRLFSPATSSDLYLGWRPTGIYSGGAKFRGAMDEMTVYYRALTPAEIQAIHVAGSNGKCTPQPGCLRPLDGLVSWWRGESNVLDSVDGNHGSNTPPALYTNGVVGTALQLQSGRYVQVPASASLDVGVGPGLTFETWMLPSPSQSSYAIAAWNTGQGTQGVSLGTSPQRGPNYLEANVVDTAGNSHLLRSPFNAVTNGGWHHVATTYDNASGAAVLYVNGSPVAATNLGIFTPRTSGKLYLGYRPPGNYPGGGYGFVGAMDEPAVYARALTSGEITALYRNTTNRCMEAPVIVHHPESLRVNAGTDVLLSVEAMGNPVLRYQWFLNGKPVLDERQAPLPSANTATLSLTNVRAWREGIYHVVVSNAFGFAVSSNALLLVNYPPVADASATRTRYILPLCTNAVTAVLDGSLTTDPDQDPLDYQWLSTLNAQPSTLLATDLVAVVTLPKGTHSIDLIVDDGLLQDTHGVTIEIVSTVAAIEGLTDTVKASSVKPLHKLALAIHLELAAHLVGQDRSVAAVIQLEIFKRKVQRWVAPEEPALAEAWTAEAQAIMDAIKSCWPGQSALEQLLAMVRASDLPPQLKAVLEAKLLAAIEAANGNDAQAAAEQVAAFIAEVESRPDADVAEVLANAALAAVNDAQAQRGRIRPLASQDSRRMQMTFNGVRGQIYLVEASTDMVTWVRIGVARETADGLFEFEDTHTPNPPCRFYRIVRP